MRAIGNKAAGRIAMALSTVFAPLFMAACVISAPIVPYPESVMVPPPAKANPRLPYEELREVYTTSPNRNPDGLGLFFPLDPSSTMTLWSLQLELRREELNRIAYARGDSEQEAILRKAGEFHARHVVFEGLLMANGPEFVDARWYLPEGIYLLDDAGRKFLPTNIAESLGKSAVRGISRRAPAATNRADLRPRAEGLPVIVFPGEAIRDETRALTLYFAAAGRRFSFTWIFDSSYSPPRRASSFDAGSGMERLFGSP